MKHTNKLTEQDIPEGFFLSPITGNIVKKPETSGQLSIASTPPAVPAVVPTTDIPSWIKDANINDLGLTQEDILMPRILLAQPANKAVTGLDPNTPKVQGLSAGMFFNNSNGRVYGETLEVVISYMQNSRYYKPKDDNGDSCYSANAIDGGRLSPLCSTCEFARNGCVRSMNYHVIVTEGDGFSDEAILSLKSTKLDIGRSINSKVAMTKKPFYAFRHLLTAITAMGKDNDGKPAPYYSFTAKTNGFVSELQYKTANAIAFAMRGVANAD